ncbi:MAG: phosphoglucosamine mutase [Spirochaetes bacterium]|nr:phosphoglucosamine mutase [Spirochaetota bacterium]
MSDKNLKASVSGIRGIIGESFTPPVIEAYVYSYCRWLKSGTVAVGRDGRKSGGMVQSLVQGALLANGINVIDIGICPTPTLLNYVREKGLDGGIIITASHNPIKWNALKLVKKGGIFLNKADFDIVSKNFKSKDRLYADINKIGLLCQDTEAVNIHIDSFIKKYDISHIKTKRYRVAVDPVNGAGSVMFESFLKRLGCNVFSVNDEITGFFSRPPEPRPGALSDLSKTVIDNKCVIGFAFDPDADRLCLVDENGTALSEEYTLALAILSFYKRRNTGDISVNVSTTRLIDDIAAKNLTNVFRSQVGEANVLEEMKKRNAVIGGEGNGGVIYPALNPCRDAFVGMLLILDLLSRQKKTISTIVSEMPSYIMIKDKIILESVKGIKEKVKKVFSDADFVFKENNIDGIRLDFKTGWIHIRESNTEPVVRIIAEGTSKKEVSSWVSFVKEAL